MVHMLGHLKSVLAVAWVIWIIRVAAQLLAKLDNTKLKHIVAAHLSAKNNTQDLAKTALSNALNCEADWIGIAQQTSGFEWRGFS